MSEVTHILSALDAGHPHAAQQLLPLVYDELRKLAAARIAAEPMGQSLDATGLLHEAYLRLVGDQKFANRAHFFAAAAEAMRRVMIDRARNRNRIKRGGGRRKVDLNLLTSAATAADDNLLELSDALDGLARHYPTAADLVKLRFFGGMSHDEAADALDLSVRTAYRHWIFARAWLAAELMRK